MPQHADHFLEKEAESGPMRGEGILIYPIPCISVKAVLSRLAHSKPKELNLIRFGGELDCEELSQQHRIAWLEQNRGMQPRNIKYFIVD